MGQHIQPVGCILNVKYPTGLAPTRQRVAYNSNNKDDKHKSTQFDTNIDVLKEVMRLVIR